MLKKINYVLDKRQKINLCILLVIILISAFVELLGVSAILPIVNIALDPSYIEKEWYLTMLMEWLGFTDPKQMLVFLAFVLIAIYVVKNLYITLVYYLQYRFVFNNQKRLAVKMMESYMHQNYLFHVSKNVAELQVKNGSSWTTVETWADTQNGYRASVYENYSVTKEKTYRVKATATAWEGSQSEIQTVFSNEKTA